MKLSPICPHCNSIQATESYCPACHRKLGSEDWKRKRDRVEDLNEGEGARQEAISLPYLRKSRVIVI